ncbi:riboflavin synthase, alpha subunit [Fusobacterium necrophorum subsp. funduliforme ATCC 51357]|uniref:Riboflavin synthase n=1 Tax=Fusobacterium necrophorum subsp. funduliforme TaxID=143387 RepID=A0A161PPS8_9FUSO|nr:riboflavin synthase [Fusobacterium necrophorum]AYV93709.1 riboflavin synthase [Fusobacterium necrophorum subsp. funduliforme]EIJ68677.1 riboflavin synthase, alpha subunit [Fusobacterium necrophorum subsp. funduliforme ATCC 51357]KAB0553011.1 riboflavin synthase [Fusobacterium necrophorum subsp. funduliforme]KYL01120.1 riboflavin synthase subunit alpha [Fusobacterium necrophorum subsp. funduliforme]KYM42136.1 riboflavin synthase subunit alpha [Fusobacterium necrophorum subsp. funduliforme]
MFTGLVEEMGRVLSITEGNHSIQIKIQCKKVLEGAKLGDSIATNGTCLTAVEIGKNYFVADCMHETMKRTNLHRLKKSDFVNLEKSITLSTPLGGHLVTGDVDCEGKIIEIRQDGIAKIYTVELPKQYMKYVVEKGRVTLDGASLTVMELGEYTLGVSLIPHSQEMIILGKKKVGDYINVETDLIGKYVEKLLSFPKQEEKNSKLSLDFLAKNGF